MLGRFQQLSLWRYFLEVRDELKKVTWPSRQQTVEKTVLVIVANVVVGAYIGLLDYGYTQLMSAIIK